MKKIISIIMITIICLGLFGCASKPSESKTPKEVDISEFPDAEEFNVFEWPSFGMGTKLPTAMWSNRGRILLDTETTVWVRVGYSTLDNYKDYIKFCQNAGFTENYFNLADTIYYAENTEGYSILLIYSKYEQFIDAKIATDTSDWDKWWEDEK